METPEVIEVVMSAPQLKEPPGPGCTMFAHSCTMFMYSCNELGVPFCDNCKNHAELFPEQWVFKKKAVSNYS